MTTSCTIQKGIEGEKKALEYLRPKFDDIYWVSKEKCHSPFDILAIKNNTKYFYEVKLHTNATKGFMPSARILQLKRLRKYTKSGIVRFLFITKRGIFTFNFEQVCKINKLSRFILPVIRTKRIPKVKKSTTT